MDFPEIEPTVDFLDVTGEMLDRARHRVLGEMHTPGRRESQDRIRFGGGTNPVCTNGQVSPIDGTWWGYSLSDLPGLGEGAGDFQGVF